MASDSDEEELLDWFETQSGSFTLSPPTSPSSSMGAAIPGHIIEAPPSHSEDAQINTEDIAHPPNRPSDPSTNARTQPYSRSRPRQPLANGQTTRKSIPVANRGRGPNGQPRKTSGPDRVSSDTGHPTPLFNESIPGAPADYETESERSSFSRSRVNVPPIPEMPEPANSPPNVTDSDQTSVIAGDQQVSVPKVPPGPRSHNPRISVRMNRTQQLRQQQHSDNSPDRKPISSSTEHLAKHPVIEELRQSEQRSNQPDPDPELDPETSSVQSEPMVHMNRAAKLRQERSKSPPETSSETRHNRSNSIGSVGTPAQERRQSILRQQSEPDVANYPWSSETENIITKTTSEGSLASRRVSFDDDQVRVRAGSGGLSYTHAYLKRRSRDEVIRRPLPLPPTLPPPNPRTTAPIKFIPKNPTTPAVVVTKAKVDTGRYDRTRNNSLPKPPPSLAPSVVTPVQAPIPPRPALLRPKPAPAKKTPEPPSTKNTLSRVQKTEKEKEEKEKSAETTETKQETETEQPEEDEEGDEKSDSSTPLVSRPKGFISSLLRRKSSGSKPAEKAQPAVPKSPQAPSQGGQMAKNESKESKDSGVPTTDESQSSSSSSSPPTGTAKGEKSDDSPAPQLINKRHGSIATNPEVLKPLPEESESDTVSQTGSTRKKSASSLESSTKTDGGLEDEDDMDSYANREDVSAKLLIASQKGQWNLVDKLLQTADKRHLNLSMIDEHGLTTLMLAIKDNRIGTVEKLLELGADIDDGLRDGRNAAHIAAMYSKDDMMRFLIPRKVDISKRAGTNQQLPLHMAASRPTQAALSIVQILLKTSATNGKPEDRYAEDSNGCNALLLACESGVLPVVKELLSSNGERQARLRRKDTGDTALHFACRRKDHDMAKLLLANGAQVNVQNKEGRTPLHVVAAEGDEAMLRIFYSHKADANIADKDDKTPLHIAAEKGFTTVVEILADKFKASVLARTKDGSTLMHIASKFGHSDTAMAFLKRGVPLYMPNKSGALGLHMAAAMGYVDVVKALLAKGTPVNSRTKDNYTALHVAVQAGKPAVVEALLGYGADVHVKGGKQGETALHVAAALDGPGSRYCAEMLLKSGADPNMKLENGETALHIASKRGNTNMIQLLLDEGAEPASTSKVGESPLHVGAVNCHYEVCKMLLDYVEHTQRREDATNFVNLQTIEGETSLHYAAEIAKDSCHYTNEDVRLVELLLDYGGEVNIQTQLTGEIVLHYCSRSGNEMVLTAIVTKVGAGGVQLVLNKQDKSGWSPLMEACAKGHLPIVRILLQYHARVDVFDEHGKTALHLAAENGHVEICDILLRNKAFINSKTKLGVTPLHLACMQGHTKVVNLLVQLHKASTDSTTSDGRTPLHLAAQNGQLSVCSVLISLGANANAKDSRGQTPLHLAAESDHPEVVKSFLKLKPDLSTLTATDENGFTCAHIAAMKGSVAVIKELMLIDKSMVTEARTKTTEATTLHMAAAGGHKTVAKILLNAGASPNDENSNGMTPLHLAARYGHVHLLEVFNAGLAGKCGRKTGLNPMHVAAYYGQMDFVRAILREVSATCRSEPPTNFNPLITKELSQDYGLTPLHMAAQSGHEGLVRMLLNQSGVQVDASSATMGVVPLHLAAQSGHIAVVGLLLSRSTTQLHIKDSKGRTGLHMAASQGHYEMVSLLIAQGSNINALDQNGWTPLHFATNNGHTQVVKLLLESNADPMAETRDGKVAICFAASSNQEGALSYLMHHTHDTNQLMEDRKFVYDLMVCGKSHNNKSIEEFILLSPAPIDTAVKMSSLYTLMASKEKERARDLTNVATFCEATAVELLSIISSEYKPAVILKAKDSRQRPFIDVLIENDQKEVVSHPAVQGYLTEVWSGGVTWGLSKFTLFFLLVLFCPPAWVFFSLPFTFRVSEAPIIKFICHLVSHTYFTGLLVMETLCVIQPIYTVESFWPNWLEWILLLWLSGLLVDELMAAGGRSGIGFVRMIIVFLSALAVLTHIAAFTYPPYFLADQDDDARKKSMQTLLYMKNQFFAFSVLLGFIRYLEFLTVHHLFGPWAIIIRDLMYDMARFLVILMLFMAGFTLHITSIFQPAFAAVDDDSQDLMQLIDPAESLEMLFFGLFGIVEPTNMPPLHLVPDIGRTMLKLVFGLYLMVILIVLINLLIAMMSDTYQRIQMQSDIEWKFGRAKLIRQMNKKSAVPAPVNMFTKAFTVLRVAWRHKGRMCTQNAQDDITMEENVDAYSMREQGGRISPTFNANDKGSMNGRLMDRIVRTEAGQQEWKLEQAINWKRIVDLYFKYRGSETSEAKEETEQLL